jgi:hypothetical protein
VGERCRNRGCVGAAFFLVAKITSWGTTFLPDKVSLFWPPTGVSCTHNKPLRSKKPMTTTICLMLIAIVTVGAVGWHGRGRWY